MSETTAGRVAAKGEKRRRFDSITGSLSKIGANIGTLALFLIMITAVVDVAGRRLSDRSVPGMLESAEVILVVAAFLGLAYAQRAKQHVSTTFIIERLPAALARWLRTGGLLIVTLYVGWAALLSAARAGDSFKGGEVRFGLIEIPQWPARMAIALGFGLLLLEVLRDLRNAALGRPRKGEDRQAGTL